MRAGLIALVAVCLLGCDWFNPPEELTVENLSNNDGWSSYPCVVCGPAGNTVVLWDEDSDGYEKIVMVEKQPGGQWSALSVVSCDTTVSRFVDACYDSSGNLHVVYQQYTPIRWTIIHRQRSPDGAWSVEEVVGGSWAFVPRIDIGPSQRLNILYIEGLSPTAEAFYATRDSGGRWHSELVCPSGELDAVDVCEMADSRVLAFWIGSWPLHTFSATRGATGGWTSVDTPSTSRASAFFPRVCRAAESAYVVYGQSVSGGRVVVQSYQEHWSVPDMSVGISNGSAYSIEQALVSGRVALAVGDAANVVHLLQRGRRWTELARVEGLRGLGSVSMAVNRATSAYSIAFVTRDNGLPDEVRYAEFRPGD